MRAASFGLKAEAVLSSNHPLYCFSSHHSLGRNQDKLSYTCRSERRTVKCSAEGPRPSRRSLLLGVGLALTLPLPAFSENLIDGQGAIQLISVSETDALTQAQKKILEFNQRTQRQNNAPEDFPNFLRDGYDMTIVADGYQVSPEGLYYKDFVEGSGDYPQDGQQVTFDYSAYNENAALIDSSYTKGAPAQTRLGINGLIPGFEVGIKSMKPGGKRRIVVPPELGPPVGPSTFFSAKQYEVFDIVLRSTAICQRQTVGMFSKIVCESQ